MVIWLWMYATRLRRSAAQTCVSIPSAARGTDGVVAARVRWKADNYNHLMEQPTIFYAIAVVLAVIGEGEADRWATRLAWAYVGLRIAHSLVQVLWNRIEVRFSLFTLSTLALIGMIVIALRAVV